MKSLPLLLLLLSFTASSLAQDVKLKGHRYPRTQEAHGTVWSLQGAEHYVYKVLFSVFTGALYQQENGDGQRLQFTYTRKLKADDLRKQALKHLEATQSAEQMERFATPLTGLQRAYVNVNKGDSYTITVLPGEGSWLELNGETIFFTEDTEFGFWYLGIWLGDPPIDADLKRALTTGENL